MRPYYQALKEHLGIDYFYDSAKDGENPNYKQRTTPDFDWSKTPLEPEEGKSASAVLVPPQADHEEFIERVPVLVDNLKARLGGELDFSKKSIDLIDEWLCKQLVDNASYDEWQSVVVERELAAYTGEVIRRITGGEWVVEDAAGTRHAVVRYAQATRKHFNPWPLVSEVLYEGVEEAEYEDGGMAQTVMNAALFSWMTTHLPIEAAKWLGGN